MIIMLVIAAILGPILTAMYCDGRVQSEVVRASELRTAIGNLRDGLDMHHIGKHNPGLRMELDALFGVLK